MHEHNLKQVVVALWDCDFGDEFPRPFHYALCYFGIYEALDIPIKLCEGELWDSISTRFSTEESKSDGEH